MKPGVGGNLWGLEPDKWGPGRQNRAEMKGQQHSGHFFLLWIQTPSSPTYCFLCGLERAPDSC